MVNYDNDLSNILFGFLTKVICKENYAYVMHHESTKMYRTIKKNYWWLGMKRDIVEFVTRCLVCQQVRQNTRDLQELISLYPSLNGSGNISPWIL